MSGSVLSMDGARPVSTTNFTNSVQGDQIRPGLEFQRILVPTDFSPGARNALDCARLIAAKFKSQIFLLHVIPRDVFELASEETSLEALAKARQFAEQQLQRLANDGGPNGIVHNCLVAEGSPWPVISEVIKTQQIDLVAVGTHGKTASKKLVLGSVAEEVYRMADCPILTVPPQIEIGANEGVQCNAVLFPTNFKPHNERAACVAHLFECRQEAKLTVLHVVDGSPEGSSPGQKLVEEFLLKRMRKALPDGCVENCRPDFEVRFGTPAEEILAAARRHHTSLIVLGLRAKPRNAGHLPSAVAYSVVCQSVCPVLTLHQ